MQVGDMVYMRGAQSKRGKFTEDPSHLGIIQDTRFHWGDDKCEYQVKWFYTMVVVFNNILMILTDQGTGSFSGND